MSDPEKSGTSEVVSVSSADVGAAYDQIMSGGGDPAPLAPTDGQPATDGAPAPEPIEAPTSWDATMRERFAQAPREWQEFLIERHKSTEGDYTKKMEALANERRQYENQVQFANVVAQQWAPLAQYYQGNPLYAMQVAQAYLNRWHSDPKGLVQALARQAGYELPPSQDEFTDPNLRPLYDKVTSIEKAQQQQQRLQQEALVNWQRQQQQAVQQQIDADIHSFRTAKDAKGQPAHPHFDKPEVQELMGALMAQFPQQYDMEKAYARAVATLPQPANPAAKVRDAKLAATGVQGVRGAVDPSKLSLRDHLALEYDKMATR